MALQVHGGVPITVLQDARRALADFGVYVMNQVDLSRSLQIVGDEWEELAAHWHDLAPDPYAAAMGTTRLRRYGKFGLTEEGLTLVLPHSDFVAPLNTGSLYAGRPRSFEPLTDGFTSEPLLGRLVAMLGWLAGALDSPDRWIVKVHPFRMLAEDGGAQPTPEGVRRDRVTLVASLLIRRRNVVGGESTVVDADGRPMLTATLVEPGTMVLSDDRRTLHGVSPIRPAVPGRAALRDVLFITFAPG
jgi:hypothetical protein